MTIRPAGPVRVVCFAIATALLAMWVRSPVAAAAATSSQPFTLTSSAMQVTGFSYIGVVTIRSGTGPIAVLEFVMSTASLTALDIVAPCTGTSAVETMVAPGLTAQASGGLTLDVTSLQATINGVAVSYTTANPPASQPLPSGNGTLSNVSIVAMAVSAPSLSMGPMSVRTMACPLAAARPAPPTPAPSPTAGPPIPSPSASPIAWPTPSPSRSPSPSPTPFAWPTPSPSPTPIQWPTPTALPTPIAWPTPTPSATQ